MMELRTIYYILEMWCHISEHVVTTELVQHSTWTPSLCSHCTVIPTGASHCLAETCMAFPVKDFMCIGVHAALKPAHTVSVSINSAVTDAVPCITSYTIKVASSLSASGHWSYDDALSVAQGRRQCVGLLFIDGRFFHWRLVWFASVGTRCIHWQCLTSSLTHTDFSLFSKWFHDSY